MQRSESSLSPFAVRKQRLRIVKSFVTQLGSDKVKGHGGYSGSTVQALLLLCFVCVHKLY